MSGFISEYDNNLSIIYIDYKIKINNLLIVTVGKMRKGNYLRLYKYIWDSLFEYQKEIAFFWRSILKKKRVNIEVYVRMIKFLK